MFRSLIAATFAALPVPALAGPVLWRDVAAGAPRAELDAKYPVRNGVKHKTNEIELKNVAISEGCEAEVSILFKGGLVDQVAVKGTGAMGGRCAERVLTGLSARYGQPLSDQAVQASPLFGRPGRVAVWRREGVALRFKRFDTGGLALKSWELVYTPVDAVSVDL